MHIQKLILIFILPVLVIKNLFGFSRMYIPTPFFYHYILGNILIHYNFYLQLTIKTNRIIIKTLLYSEWRLYKNIQILINCVK